MEPRNKLEENEEGGIEKLRKSLFIPDERELHQKRIEKEGVVFNFLYTSLKEDFLQDSFDYAMEVFSLAFQRMVKLFPHPEELSCFSESYPVNIFLAKDFDELCTVGSPEKRELPAYVRGRTSGSTLIYTQDSFIDDSKKEPSELSERKILGKAHELLHIYLKHNRSAKYGNEYRPLPFLFNEGLTVICAKQLTKDFADPFVSPEQLFLENGIQAFKYDQRWIIQNSYYQSAGHFMDYLLKTISEREGLSYGEAFQKVFDTIGCPEGSDGQGDFDAKKYLKNVFGLDIAEEYNNFLAKVRG